MSRVLTALLFAALAFAYPAVAQDKKTERKAERAQKVLIDNDKVRVVETTTKPGEGRSATERPYRVVRVIQGGTLERTYADGKKDKVDYKAGDVRELVPGKPYSTKNIGKTDVVLYIVELKQAGAASKSAKK